MKKLLTLILAVCLVAVPVQAAVAVVSNTAAGSSDTFAVTTGTINTSGATCLVVLVSWYNGMAATVVVSDSKSNTWTPLTSQATSNDTEIRFYYACGGTVGTNHTFTADSGATTSFPCLAAIAVSGTLAASAHDQESAGDTADAATSVQGASLTPSQNNEIVFSGLGLDDPTGTPTINGGFTVSNTVVHDGANHVGCGLAYLIQTSAAAANPTWSWTTAVRAAAINESFKAATTIPVLQHHRRQQRNHQ